MTTNDRRGWFADWDNEATNDYAWQPCLETGRGHIPCFDVRFRTKAECEQWIADNVIGVGWLPGEPTRESGPPKPDTPIAVAGITVEPDRGIFVGQNGTIFIAEERIEPGDIIGINHATGRVRPCRP